jgi:hypothetical protein
MALGLLISFIPLIIFDVQNNGVWIKSVIEYYTVGVNKFYVPVRWLTELRDFWPQLFGAVTVGWNSFGYVWIILGIILLFRRRKIDKFWWVVGVSFLIQILLMRNYKGVRSREYLIAFYGFVILICSWITSEWFKLNKYVGGFLLGVIIILASVNNWQNIKQNPSQARDILEIKREIDRKINGSVSIKHFQQSDMVSMPVFYLYYRESRIGGQNVISICDGNKYTCPTEEDFNNRNYRIYVNQDFGWYKLTPENVYDRLMVNYPK